MDDWRDIPGYPNYMINAYGNLYNKSQDSYPRGTFNENTTTYYRVKPGDIRLTSSKPQIMAAHRLVGMAFLGYDRSVRVYHRDGDLHNNHYTNVTTLNPAKSN